jgi:hypothetical protein
MLTMGSIYSAHKSESRDDITTKKDGDLVNNKLSCGDFGPFNGRSDQWIIFKENTLSKSGVWGYAQYFKPDYTLNENTREGNQRIFYLPQNATNGGGTSHIIQKHIKWPCGMETPISLV